MIATKLSPMDKESTEILVQLSLLEEDNTHPRVIEGDSCPRVQSDNMSEKIKVIDTRKKVKLSPKVLSLTNYLISLVKSNKLTSSSTTMSISKVAESSCITQPTPAAYYQYPTRAKVAAAANTTQIEQQ